MQKVVSVAVMRQSDAETIRGGIPGRELMFSAGRGVLERHAWKGPVAIVAGSGNNGGDGYVLALLLKEKSIPCPDCGKHIDIFGKSNTEATAKQLGFDIIGKLPMDAQLASLVDRGVIELFENDYLEHAADVIEQNYPADK